MLALLVGLAVAAPPPGMLEDLARMVAASDAMRDATYTLERTEWVGGEQRPTETIAVRYRRPETLWLEWTGDVYPGRKVRYEQGWNDGRLRVRPSSFLPLFNFDPTGAVAMRDSRHPVWMSSLDRIVRKLDAVIGLVAATPGSPATFVDEGERVEAGVPSRCYRATLPYDRDPRLYAPVVRFCGGLESRLPTRFSAWKEEDGASRRVEDYVFRDLVVNPGLGAEAFDPAGM
jgi:hypothetical protein